LIAAVQSINQKEAEYSQIFCWRLSC